MTTLPRRAPRFVLVGASAFVLGAAAIEALVALGLSPYAAQVPVFLGGATYTWWLNRRLTFGVAAAATAAEYARYLASSAGGFVVSMAIFSLLIRGGWMPAAALAAGTIAGLAFNFVAYDRFAFRGAR